MTNEDFKVTDELPNTEPFEQLPLPTCITVYVSVFICAVADKEYDSLAALILLLSLAQHGEGQRESSTEKTEQDIFLGTFFKWLIFYFSDHLLIL